jgi:hypothetical protein
MQAKDDVDRLVLVQRSLAELELLLVEPHPAALDDGYLDLHAGLLDDLGRLAAAAVRR